MGICQSLKSCLIERFIDPRARQEFCQLFSARQQGMIGPLWRASAHDNRIGAIYDNLISCVAEGFAHVRNRLPRRCDSDYFRSLCCVRSSLFVNSCWLTCAVDNPMTSCFPSISDCAANATSTYDCYFHISIFQFTIDVI